MTQQFGLARVAWFSGDFSDAARRWAILAKDPGLRWAAPSQLSLEETKYILNLSDARPQRPALPTVGSARFGPRAWMTAGPDPSEWRKRNRSLAATLVHYDENVVAAKLMLNAGRASELASTYNSRIGLLGIRRGQPIGPCQLDEAAVVALALRSAGRGNEATALLREADRLIGRLYGRGRVPTWFDEDAAGIWAAEGKTKLAIEALERARDRGWLHVGRTDLPSLAEEPAFRALRGDPRFKAVLASYDAHFSRERQETARDLNL
jgi:hypothetical protein